MNDKKFHIMVDGHIVTTEPMSLQQIQQYHGGVKKLEASGARLVPHKPTAPVKKNDSYFTTLAKNYLLSNRRKVWDKVMSGAQPKQPPAHLAPEKGVHQPGYGKGWTKYGENQWRQHGGISEAGRAVRTRQSAKRKGNWQGAGKMKHEARGYHRRVLEEIRAMKAPVLKAGEYFANLKKKLP